MFTKTNMEYGIRENTKYAQVALLLGILRVLGDGKGSFYLFYHPER